MGSVLRVIGGALSPGLSSHEFVWAFFVADGRGQPFPWAIFALKRFMLSPAINMAALVVTLACLVPPFRECSSPVTCRSWVHRSFTMTDALCAKEPEQREVSDLERLPSQNACPRVYSKLDNTRTRAGSARCHNYFRLKRRVYERARRYRIPS